MTAADVAELEAFTSGLRALDYRYGGGRSRAAAVARLPSAVALLDLPGAGEVVVPLHTAVADLHNLAGWASFDTGLDDAALRHFTTALRLAASVGNASLTANVYYRMGRVRLHGGATARALAEFQLGERAARTSSALEVALLNANQAWALARLGAEHDAVALLARVGGTPAGDGPLPGWVAFFTAADRAAITGVVRTELAQTVDPRHVALAVPALEEAVDGFGPDMARSRAFSLISLATCYLLDDQVDAGVALGEQVVTLCGQLVSTRTADRLRPLRNEAARRKAHPGARALVERIRAFQPARDGPP
ncbi:hypothetical protein FHS29_002485 [Saccharothrix tamanrassetensis]|uniref:Transcriptional regulator n=1 Tax=Saccharothrix tamanrassetensis TaxID=1051531 RepID=A0A841CHR1_9PSEU|nr:tetratricopeptide repeat protein [Saccharothrix tamanrassetensis]MBB5955904.1 hypothetical protein [Saccharothrix tamanrassetensis]